MKLLVVTNLYPPQELGGYGRCISDFVWGLMQLGHSVHVACSDASYLGPSDSYGPSGESVSRKLTLKGSFNNGVSIFQDSKVCQAIDEANSSVFSSFSAQSWDGLIVGNIDLLGHEILPCLFAFNCKILHHIGFVSPPYPSYNFPKNDNYLLISASRAVRTSLCASNFPVHDSPIVYPGVRLEYFTQFNHGLSPSLNYALSRVRTGFALGTPSNPLKLGFAGLLMASKGAHLLIQAIIRLNQQGYAVQANFAGTNFQSGYRDVMDHMLVDAQLSDTVRFVGHLNRHQLFRFWSLHHVGVFPSIHPEAFGISAAEVMAAGLVLLSSGVGGASELFEHKISGVRFLPDDVSSLVEAIMLLLKNPTLLFSIASSGQKRVRKDFSVLASTLQLQSLLLHS